METYEQVLVFFGGVGLLLTAFNLVASAVKNWSELRKPDKEREEKIDKMLASDKRRLDEHERALAEDREGLRVLCRGVRALLDHELHNGNSEEMQHSSDALNTWLIDR